MDKTYQREKNLEFWKHVTPYVVPFNHPIFTPSEREVVQNSKERTTTKCQNYMKTILPNENKITNQQVQSKNKLTFNPCVVLQKCDNNELFKHLPKLQTNTSKNKHLELTSSDSKQYQIDKLTGNRDILQPFGFSFIAHESRDIEVNADAMDSLKLKCQHVNLKKGFKVDPCINVHQDDYCKRTKDIQKQRIIYIKSLLKKNDKTVECSQATSYCKTSQHTTYDTEISLVQYGVENVDFNISRSENLRIKCFCGCKKRIRNESRKGCLDTKITTVHLKTARTLLQIASAIKFVSSPQIKRTTKVGLVGLPLIKMPKIDETVDFLSNLDLRPTWKNKDLFKSPVKLQRTKNLRSLSNSRRLKLNSDY